MQNTDHSTRELTRLRLKLRDDLVFTPQEYDGQTYYHVELPSRAKFYRIGLPEYTFVSLLDGNTSVAEALVLTARSLGQEAFSENEATSICTWLIDTGLAENNASADSDAALFAESEETAADQERKKWISRLNPLWMRLPLFNPDRTLRAIFPWVGWIHSAAAFIVWSIVFGMAVTAVFSDWTRFINSSTGVLAPSNWMWLGASWLILKVVHEFSHGLAARKYNGEVREMGVILILLAPMAYVDLTSSWRFRSRWQRMHTAVAGMYVELFIAAVAALLWSGTRSPELSHHYFNIIFMASLTTLLFNANPLMRFDGYYVLSDLLQIPNLYPSGTKYVHSLARRIFLGGRDHGVEWQGSKGVFVRCYGLAAFAWRILVCVGLVIAAAALFHGAGIVLAVVAVAMWLGLPALGMCRTLRNEFSRDPAKLGRFVTVAGGLSAALAFLLLCVPWPGGRTAPGFVEYSPMHVLRAETPGFVRAINVADGQLVERDTVLVVLENEEIDAEVRELTIGIQEAEAKRRIHLQDNEPAAAQVEAENAEALRKRLAEKTRKLDALTLRAPIRGRVIARDLESLIDTWLTDGTEVLTVADENQKEFQISVSQEDAKSFQARLSQSVQMRIRGRHTLAGKLTRLTPRASQEAPHDCLCAPVGGPLPVRVKETDEEGEESWQLVEPRFVGYIEIPREHGLSLTAGEFGCATLRAGDESLGAGVYKRVARWLDEQVRVAGLH